MFVAWMPTAFAGTIVDPRTMLHREEDITMIAHDHNRKYDVLTAELARQLRDEDGVLPTDNEVSADSFPPSGEKAGTVGGE